MTKLQKRSADLEGQVACLKMSVKSAKATAEAIVRSL